jgi:hypothetical protein
MTRRLARPCRALIVLCGSALALVSGGCRPIRPLDEAGITARAGVRPATVPAGSPFAVDYSWTIRPGASPPPEGYGAFVHFVHPDGAVAFTDDHAPEPPPSAWRPGQTYRYTRTVLAPAGAFPGKLQVRVGLFHPQRGRLGLAGRDAGLQEYVAGEVEVTPGDDRRRLRYGAGWYPPDAPPGDPFGDRRWTRPEAWLAFRNRLEDVVVLIRGETNYKAFAKPPVLSLAIGDAVARVPIASSAPFEAAVRFPAAALGKDRWAELKLAMNGSFVPSALGMNADQRELGLWVHHVIVGPASEVEPVLAPALAPIRAAAPVASPPARPAQKSK